MERKLPLPAPDRWSHQEAEEACVAGRTGRWAASRLPLWRMRGKLVQEDEPRGVTEEL